MKNTKFALAGLGILAATVLPISPVKAEQIVKNYFNHPQWTRIVNPDVNVSPKAYPDITFRNGDSVWIKAGGCVQTGGRGRTWKRYVNPTGPNSNILYHGQILIPGAINSLTNFSELISDSKDTPAPWFGQLVISNPANVGVLKLGYLDDSYGDNGYEGHDNGTEDQCRNDFGAYVDIWIQSP